MKGAAFALLLIAAWTTSRVAAGPSFERYRVARKEIDEVCPNSLFSLLRAKCIGKNLHKFSIVNQPIIAHEFPCYEALSDDGVCVPGIFSSANSIVKCLLEHPKEIPPSCNAFMAQTPWLLCGDTLKTHCSDKKTIYEEIMCIVDHVGSNDWFCRASIIDQGMHVFRLHILSAVDESDTEAPEIALKACASAMMQCEDAVGVDMLKCLNAKSDTVSDDCKKQFEKDFFATSPIYRAISAMASGETINSSQGTHTARDEL